MSYPVALHPLWWLITGTKGGPARAKIIKTLKDKPQNTNQLAHLLKMDYKTVQHHIELLKKNKIVVSIGEYGATYFLSQAVEDNYVQVEEILKKATSKPSKLIHRGYAKMMVKA